MAPTSITPSHRPFYALACQIIGASANFGPFETRKGATKNFIVKFSPHSLMNVSLSLLVAGAALGSSFFSLPASSGPSVFSLRLSSFARFSKPVVFSRVSLDLHSVTFKHGLSNAVFVDGTRRQSGFVTPARFFRCKFVDLSGGTGGAIEAVAPLTILFCWFENCKAENGGAVFCDSDFTSNYSRYHRIHADMDCSLFKFQQRGMYTHICANSFSRCRASRAAFVKFGSDFVMMDCNMTKAQARSLAGIEVGRDAAIVRHCNFVEFKTSSRPCAMSLWQCTGFQVTANFFNLTAGSRSPQASVVCWCDGSEQIGTFSKCVVVGVSFHAGTLIYANAGASIEIRDCCFPVEQARVFNAEPFFVVHGNRYNESCPTVRVVPQQLDWRNPVIRGKFVLELHWLFVGVGLAGAAFLLSYFLFTIELPTL